MRTQRASIIRRNPPGKQHPFVIFERGTTHQRNPHLTTLSALIRLHQLGSCLRLLCVLLCRSLAEMSEEITLRLQHQNIFLVGKH